MFKEEYSDLREVPTINEMLAMVRKYNSNKRKNKKKKQKNTN